MTRKEQAELRLLEWKTLNRKTTAKEVSRYLELYRQAADEREQRMVADYVAEGLGE